MSQDESFGRTVLDLIIMDRLRQSKDRDAQHHRLQVSADVPVAIRVKDIHGNYEMIKGKADWALGYGALKGDTGAILLIVEAKPYESAAIGMPQLLVFMAAVHKARQDRVNQSVFGMLSDSKEFRFAFLDEKKKVLTTRPFTWSIEQSTIIAHIDMMLINAIESSPHTTPQKINNRTTYKYPEFLGGQRRFGDELDDEGVEENEEEEEEDEDDDVVDVVNVGGHVTMKHYGRLRSAG